jgi:hypothetical protein
MSIPAFLVGNAQSFSDGHASRSWRMQPSYRMACSPKYETGSGINSVEADMSLSYGHASGKCAQTTANNWPDGIPICEYKGQRRKPLAEGDGGYCTARMLQGQPQAIFWLVLPQR